jgi:hypothetical protein
VGAISYWTCQLPPRFLLITLPFAGRILKSPRIGPMSFAMISMAIACCAPPKSAMILPIQRFSERSQPRLGLPPASRLSRLSVREKGFPTGDDSRSLALSRSCRLSTGKSSLTISVKPVGVGAVSQPWIAKGERSGLLTHTATTGKRLVVRADQKLTAFLELESAIRARGLELAL